MTTTIDLNEEKLQAFLDRAFTDLAACYGGVMVSLGDRLGLYRALAGAGPLTSAELAERAGCAERYVREWLGSQVAAAYVDYDPESETYELPAEHAAVLADPRQPDAAHPRLQRPGVDVERRGAGGQGVSHRRGSPMGSARRPPLLRSRGVLQERLQRRARPAVAARPRRGGRAPRAGREGGRHRLRSRPLDGADGRGVPELDVPRHRSARGLDRGRERQRRGGRCLGPGQLLGGDGRRPRGAGLRPDLLLRRAARHGRSRRRGAARPLGARRRRHRHAGRAVRRGSRRGQPGADRPPLLLGVDHALLRPRALGGRPHVLGAQAGEARLAEVFDEAGFSHWRVAEQSPFNLVLEARA